MITVALSYKAAAAAFQWRRVSLSVYHLKFLDTAELAAALGKLGADSRSLPFFDNRREVKALCVPNVDARAANVIKQELLSRGGDAAVHANVINMGVKHRLSLIHI